MTGHWRKGNRTLLLKDGDDFFPRVFAAIDAAEREILLQTFILSDDKVGRELRDKLIAAARRGLRISVTVDGFGSPGLEGEFLNGLVAAGVNFRIFNPGLTLLGFRTNLFRRLHSKILVIDGRLAYIGGINFIADQLSEFGPEAKRDFAIEIEGPVVNDIHDFALRASPWPRSRPGRRQRHSDDKTMPAGARMLFVHRDNRLSRDSIERQYHLAIRQAQRELIIANAYFLPGYRFLWRLRRAAKRGVKVTLIVQGRPDIGIIKWATSQLYGYLLSGGVEIFEYHECQLHAKVAIVDDEWSTIGSSNLDPTSLSLNLEANVVVMDRGFNGELHEDLRAMIEEPECRRISADSLAKSRWWSGPTSVAVFHFLRHFPAWAGQLPAHSIELKKVEDSRQITPTDDTTDTPQGVPANQES